ncbi:MAG: hypothetical protein R3Y36_03520 [Spirochaetales bacterium]
MKNIAIYFFVALMIFAASSCETTEESVPVEDTTIEIMPEVELENVAEPQIVMQEEDPEYVRSTVGMGTAVSFDTFQADKAEILAIINELDDVMKNRNFTSWKNYLTDSSVSYWSNRVNLQVLSTKLPQGGVTLRNISDYFLNMFIPSRIGQTIDEIRYVSSTQVKAVQVKNNKDIIYYEFIKSGDEWLIQLPTL